MESQCENTFLEMHADAPLAKQAIERYFFTVVLVISAAAMVLLIGYSDRPQKKPQLPIGPRGLPLLGNLPQLVFSLFPTLQSWAQKYGDVYTVRLGSRTIVVVNGHRAVRRVLLCDDFAGRPHFEMFKYMADGRAMSLNSYSPSWQVHRRLSDQAIRMVCRNCDNSLDAIIDDAVRELAQQLVVAETSRNTNRRVNVMVAKVMSFLCIGNRFKDGDVYFQRFLSSVDDMNLAMETGNPVEIFPWLRYVAPWIVRHYTQKFINALSELESVCKDCVAQHLRTYNSDKRTVRDVTDGLIRASERLRRHETKLLQVDDTLLAASLEEMMASGLSNTSAVVQWSLLLLAAFPDAQKTIQSEIDDVIGEQDTVGWDVYKQLPSVQMFMLEVIRFSATTPLGVPRCTLRDTDVVGVGIPGDTMILCNFLSIYRDKELFSDPEQFNPDRFLGQDGKPDRTEMEKVSTYAFGAGKRHCLGENVGKRIVFIAVVRILKHFTIEYPSNDCPDLTPSRGLVRVPTTPVSILLKVRHR